MGESYRQTLQQTRLSGAKLGAAPTFRNEDLSGDELKLYGANFAKLNELLSLIRDTWLDLQEDIEVILLSLIYSNGSNFFNSDYHLHYFRFDIKWMKLQEVLLIISLSIWIHSFYFNGFYWVYIRTYKWNSDPIRLPSISTSYLLTCK